MITYCSGDALELRTEGAYLAHACNSEGVAGAGIALAIAKKYPQDAYFYHSRCIEDEIIGGDILITEENKIIWMITSLGFGYNKDLENKILENTKLAIEQINNLLPTNSVIYSNKFNSGLFSVPWAKTEQLLIKYLRSDINWVVVDYKNV